MTESGPIDHTSHAEGANGYYAVAPQLVMRIFELFQMRPSHFSAGGKPGAQSVYYDAKKICEGKTQNKWGHHTARAIQDFCWFTQSEHGAFVPWQEFVEDRDAYDGKEGAGRRTGNSLMTIKRVKLNHEMMLTLRRKVPLSIEQFAEKTCLPVKFVDAMEKGQWETVAENTARLIADTLNVAPEIITIANADSGGSTSTPTAAATELQNNIAQEPVESSSRFPTRHISGIAALTICMVIAIYVIYTKNMPSQVAPDWVSFTGSTAAGLSDFALTRHEVTNAEYLQFVLQQPDYSRNNILPGMHDGDYLKNWLSADKYPPDLAQYPVTNVSWYAASAYCHWRGGRLPHLSEWRLATSALKQTLTVKMLANVNLCDRRCDVNDELTSLQSPRDVTVDDGYSATAPVTVGLQSDAGLTHLYGNVAEWLAETSGEGGDTIGGSFLSTLAEAVSDKPVTMPKRLASRDVGFRCAKDLGSTQ